MKTNLRVIIVVASLVFAVGQISATTVAWTNVLGGNWNNAANWSPNQVPGASEDALIISDGTYVVTQNMAIVVSSLTLGATNGTQTLLNTGGHDLTLDNASIIDANGVLESRGVLTAPDLNIKGLFNWNNGSIYGAVTIAAGGALNITNIGVNYYVYGALTNSGTASWSAGNIYGVNSGPNTGLIYNSGLWDAKGNNGVLIGGGTPVFINAGTFRKSGGTGTTTIGWNFTTTGTMDTQTGFIAATWAGDSVLHGTLNGGLGILSGATLTIATNAVANWNSDDMHGALIVAPGGSLNITNVGVNYYVYGALTNFGTASWLAGNIYGVNSGLNTGLIYNSGLWDAKGNNGVLIGGGTPIFINAGTFRKSGGTGTTTIGWNFTSTGTIDTQTGFISPIWAGDSVLHGTLNGGLGVLSGATLIIASSAVVNWNSDDMHGALIVAPGGSLNITNVAVNYYVYGALTNSGTVTWSAGNIYGVNSGPNSGLIYNSGLWDAKGNNGILIGGGTPVFINAGTFRKSGGLGTTTIGWNFTTTGTMDTQTGFISAIWAGDSVLHGTLNGGISLADGVTLTIASNAVANWNSGDIHGALSLDQGGILNLTNNSVSYGLYGTLTNYGTVNWAAGNIYGYNNPPTQPAFIYNAGLWDAKANNGLYVGSGAPVFINTGTFRKSGGTGATLLQMNFTTTGTVDIQTGLLDASAWADDSILHGGFTGSVNLLSNATLVVSANVTLNMTTGSGKGSLIVASNAVVNWGGGDVFGAFTVAQGGVLNITNTAFTYSLYGALTNYGTVNWSAGNIYGYNNPPNQPAFIYNAGLWDAQANNGLYIASGTPVFINTGTVRKAGTSGTTLIQFNFTTTGTMDTQTGLFSIAWAGNSTLHGTLTGGLNLAPGVTLMIAADGVANWISDDIHGALTIAGGGMLNLTNAAATYAIYGVLTNYGTVNWLKGNVYGYNTVSDAALIYNAGLWDAQSDSGFYIGSGAPTFVNAGTFNKSAGTGITLVSWSFGSSGTVNVKTGTISLSDLFVQTAGLTLLDGGKLSLGQGYYLQGGILAGTNTVTGAVTNNGVVSPGLSPGKLTITGNYTQTTNGALQIELGGTSPGSGFDQLAISGNARLAGTLEISLTNGFVPVTNSTFTIVTSGSKVGEFNSFFYPSNVVGMQVLYTANTAYLFITNAPPRFGPYVANGNFVAHFIGTPGTNYTIEWTGILPSTNWQKLTNVLAPLIDYGLGTGAVELIDPVTISNRFYRTVTPAY